jgi:recombination protein RecR
MRIAKAINNLVEAFERLPGVGPKSAQRLTYYLLHVPQGELDRFASSLSDLKKNTVECQICHNIAEVNPCDICSDTTRITDIVCVVEQPLDVLALESGNSFKGRYHVLHGTIDPLHNIGPEEIKIGELISRLKKENISEIILALNPNMEGEATCLYLKRQIELENSPVKVSRLAHGLPVGADIQYADQTTLSRALEGRQNY